MKLEVFLESWIALLASEITVEKRGDCLIRQLAGAEWVLGFCTLELTLLIPQQTVQ